MPTVYSQTYLAVPPGDLILDAMGSDRMSFDEFAEQMSIPFEDSSKLINGDIELTPTIAAQLEKVFGIEANVWLSWENSYREKIKLANAENAAADAQRGLLQLALASTTP